MTVITMGSFKRDVAQIKNPSLLTALRKKIDQIETADTLHQITGLKLLCGYSTQYRIQVRTEKDSYRIGAVIRSNTIWLVRFLSRKKIYQQFP